MKVVKSTGGLLTKWEYPNFQIFQSNRYKDFFFNVIGKSCRHVDGRTFDSYDSCFRAARNWMKNNQNLIYGEEQAFHPIYCQRNEQLVARAILAERQRCAKMAEGMVCDDVKEYDDWRNGFNYACDNIAQAILKGETK